MATGIRQAERRMLSAVSEGHIPHACFISCPDLSMAESLAKKVAAMYCTGEPDPARLTGCPDCIAPEDYKKESVSALLEDLSKSSFTGGKRAVLLLNAHDMPENMQHKLLKTIEEPPEQVLFLLTGNESGLLPTVLSRCSSVLCGLPSREEVAAELMADGASQSEAALYAAQGVTLDYALRLLKSEEFRALRQNSQAVLMELLSGRLPFEKQQAVASADGAHFMLSFMKDMLTFSTRGEIVENPDMSKDIRALAPRFTTGRISSIIESLAQAMERLNTNASPSGTFTRLFTEIAEEL